MRSSAIACRSVTHPALAGCAPSLPRLAIMRSFREDVADLGVRKKKTIMENLRKRSTGTKRSTVPCIADSFHRAGFRTEAMVPVGPLTTISDSADHAGSLFKFRPFIQKTSITSSSNPRETRISNQAAQLTVSRAGCLRSTGLAWRSVTAVAYAYAAPSLSRFTIHLNSPGDRTWP